MGSAEPRDGVAKVIAIMRPQRPSLVRAAGGLVGLALSAAAVASDDARNAALYAGLGGWILGVEVRDFIRWLVWRRP